MHFRLDTSVSQCITALILYLFPSCSQHSVARKGVLDYLFGLYLRLYAPFAVLTSVSVQYIICT